MPIKRKGDNYILEFAWPRVKMTVTIKTVSILILTLGLISLLASAFFNSYVTAFIGLGLVFWGLLMYVITPFKYVKLDLLTAVSSSQTANLERILKENQTTGKGIYLPPKLLEEYLSSLIFVPSKTSEKLPANSRISEETFVTSNGVFLTPPGLALSLMFEREIGKSFTELNLNELAIELPELLENLQITKTAVLTIEGNRVIFETGNYIFKDVCIETRKFTKSHETVGCVFSSAIACALAKASGKPVTIDHEEQNPDSETTTVRFTLLEE